MRIIPATLAFLLVSCTSPQLPKDAPLSPHGVAQSNSSINELPDHLQEFCTLYPHDVKSMVLKNVCVVINCPDKVLHIHWDCEGLPGAIGKTRQPEVPEKEKVEPFK